MASSTSGSSRPVHIIHGPDAGLRSQQLTRTLDDTVGDRDRSLCVERVELTLANLAAASTPPMFSDLRVMVARDVSKPSDELRDALAALADDPPEGTVLLIEWSSGRMPKAWRDHQAIDTIDSSPPRPGKASRSAVAAELRSHRLDLTADAVSAVSDTVGEELSRVGPIAQVLAARYGPGHRLDADLVRDYIGPTGPVPPWELTDRLDAGDPAGALRIVDRLVRDGHRHPLQLTAVLTTHYRRVFQACQLPGHNEKQVAEAYGLRGSTFPIRKAIGTARRLGPDRTDRAMLLVGEAAGQLRGRSALDPRVVLDLLVARLAHLTQAA